MSTSHFGVQRRASKRSSNACSRCRRQKIKCSGLQPCANCTKRSLSCIFDDRDNKVLVTQGYLFDLQQKIAHYERSQTNPVATASSQDHGSPVHGLIAQCRTSRGGMPSQNASLDEHEEASQSSPRNPREDSPRRDGQVEGPDLTNPLLESPSKFMSSSSGRSFYLGTSSNWSFHGQVLNVVHQHIRSTPLPGADMLFDGSAYRLPWDGTRSLPATNAPVMPSIDYAIFLINAVKFHCGQLVHLFDEEEFNAKLHAFYRGTEPDKTSNSLWYIQYLLIIAFGRTLVQRKHRDSKPPGADFFVHVLQLLPDTNRLCQEPLIAAEILCGIALYLQALDSRNAAHVTIGQAMRIALAEGMHTDMPVPELGEQFVQRCRKIWWSIYILDRQMSSQMGVPQSIRDDEISCQLTQYSGSTQRTAALQMQIRLARVYADIARNVYGPKGRLRKKFVISIKSILDDMATIAEELRSSFPLHAEERFGGISRMPAHLHLMYYQSYITKAREKCVLKSPSGSNDVLQQLILVKAIIVTTRPLLFCCLKKVFESPREVRALVSSSKIRPLLIMSLDASQKILSILESLQEQDLLETFLPWDLDSLFVSTMILVLIRFVDDSFAEDSVAWLDKAFAFLDAMIANGNKIAEYRSVELRKLEEMLSEYSTNRMPRHFPGMQSLASLPRQLMVSDDGPASDGFYISGDLRTPSNMTNTGITGMHTALSDESSGFGDDLTAEQILAIAETMDLGGSEWFNTFATMDNFEMASPQ